MGVVYMGVVYEGEDTRLERVVALKFLAPRLISDERLRKRFEREAKATAALDHPNICTVFEIDEAEGRTFLTMAFVEGQTVKDKIAARPLKLEEALAQCLSRERPADPPRFAPRERQSATCFIANGERTRALAVRRFFCKPVSTRALQNIRPTDASFSTPPMSQAGSRFMPEVSRTENGSGRSRQTGEPRRDGDGTARESSMSSDVS